MTYEIEKAANSGMTTTKSLRLSDRFQASPASAPYPRRLIRQFWAIVCVLGCIVRGFQDEFPVCKTVASQFVAHDFSLIHHDVY